MSSTTFDLNTKIYRAGAGAGKTTSLIREVYDFYKYHLKNNQNPPRVVLTTFTRKATQEMRERLMLKAQELKDDQFLDFVLSKSNLHISTIHGVLQLFLKQYGHLIELDPGFTIASSADTFRSASRILKSIICESPEHQEILEYFDFKTLVDGSVKFFEYYTVEPQIRTPDISDFKISMQNLFLEFNANSEIVTRQILEQTEDEKYRALVFNLQNLKKNLAVKTWIEDRVRILDAISALSIPRKSTKNPQVSDDLTQQLKSLVDSLKKLDDPLYLPETWTQQVEQHKRLEKLFKAFYEQFYLHKCNTGQLQMSDLEVLSYRLLKTHPDALAEFSEQWSYWLIDEFQDTSPLQVSILDSLIHKKPYFIVGDPQQSIYFFRGARQEVFLKKQKEVEAAKGILQNLSVNYRATPNLMLFVNDLFSNLNFMKMTTPSSLTTEVPAAHIVSHHEDQSEVESIVNYVSDLVSQGVRCEDIAVIARKNSNLLSIATALGNAKIPYYLHAATGFSSRREILDALSLLKFLVHPFDNANLVALLRSPWFHIGDNDLSGLLNRNEYYWNSLLQIADRFESIRRLKSLMDLTRTAGVSRAFEKGIFDSGLLDTSFVYDPSGRREANLWKLIVQLRTEEHRAGFNYLNFIKNLKLAEQTNDDEADAISSIEPNRVNLMTVHVSKGLEFKYVILPFISEAPAQTRTTRFLVAENIWNVPVKLEDEARQILPLTARADLEKIKNEELMENQRLLYVAVTRAKNQLFMTYAGSMRKNSWLSYLSLSLEPGLHREKGYSYSISQGYRKQLDSVSTASDRSKPKNAYLAPKDWKADRPKQSVTQMVETSMDLSVSDILYSLKRSEHGIKMHRLFELLHYEGEEGTLEIARAWSDDMYKMFSEAVSFLKSQNKIPIMDVIYGGSVEWGFIIKGKEWDIEGQVDLWGIQDGCLWIVDYKTGNPRFKDKAFKQLELYSLAVQRFVGAKETYLCAVFPTEKVVEVRKSLNLQELEQKFF